MDNQIIENFIISQSWGYNALYNLFFLFCQSVFLALYTAVKQYNLQVALCVLSIFAIKKCSEWGLSGRGGRKFTLLVTVHFSLQVTVLDNAVFEFLNCFVSLKNDNERIQVERIAFRSSKNLNEIDFTESFDNSFQTHYLFVPCIFLTK